MHHDGAVFRAYVEKFLTSGLGHGDIVVMDNLSPHKVANIHKAIEGAGAEVKYLPPCNLDFNPIEQVFAKLKALLRATRAYCVEALWSAIESLMDRFSQDGRERCIRHAGYCQSG